jgi:hypothetical protein
MNSDVMSLVVALYAIKVSILVHSLFRSVQTIYSSLRAKVLPILDIRMDGIEPKFSQPSSMVSSSWPFVSQYL